MGERPGGREAQNRRRVLGSLAFWAAQRRMQQWTNLDGRHGQREDSVRHVDRWDGRAGMQSNGPGCSGVCRPEALQGHRLRGGSVGSAPLWSQRSVAQRSPQSWLPPRLRCLPGKSTSGCTTRIWRVSASLRENVFSSTHRAQRTFCLRALWIVSSWRVRS